MKFNLLILNLILIFIYIYKYINNLINIQIIYVIRVITSIGMDYVIS